LTYCGWNVLVAQVNDLLKALCLSHSAARWFCVVKRLCWEKGLSACPTRTAAPKMSAVYQQTQKQVVVGAPLEIV
jgi:hypothetical protein